MAYVFVDLDPALSCHDVAIDVTGASAAVEDGRRVVALHVRDASDRSVRCHGVPLARRDAWHFVALSREGGDTVEVQAAVEGGVTEGRVEVRWGDRVCPSRRVAGAAFAVEAGRLAWSVPLVGEAPETWTGAPRPYDLTGGAHHLDVASTRSSFMPVDGVGPIQVQDAVDHDASFVLWT